MNKIKLSLIDNDFAVHAKTDLNVKDHAKDPFAKFLLGIEEELVTGKTAYLEIEGLHKDALKFAISNSE